MSMLRNRVYCRLKPFIPRAVRTAFRRRLASRLRGSIADIWPIMPGSEQPPENWPGWPHGKKFAVVLTHDVESAAGGGKGGQLREPEMTFGIRCGVTLKSEEKVFCSYRREFKKKKKKESNFEFNDFRTIYRPVKAF